MMDDGRDEFDKTMAADIWEVPYSLIHSID